LISGSSFGITAIVASFYYDLPTGYAIVFFGAFSALITVLLLDRKEDTL